jgi:hypothetical protein
MGPTLFKRSRAEYCPLKIRAKTCADGNAVSTEAAIWPGGSSMLMAMVFFYLLFYKWQHNNITATIYKWQHTNIQMLALTSKVPMRCNGSRKKIFMTLENNMLAFTHLLRALSLHI